MFFVRFIGFPQAGELPRIAVDLQHPNDPTRRNHYRVVLYIDGLIVKIQRPDHAGDAYFCGRHGKSCDSLNVQYVVDKAGRIRHIITGLSDSTRDKTAASWSIALRHFLDALPDGYVVLGDAAYRGLHHRVITPLINNGHLSPANIAFNDACTRIRQIVERSIGASELKWRVQQLKDNRIAAKKAFRLHHSARWLPLYCIIVSPIFSKFTMFMFLASEQVIVQLFSPQRTKRIDICRPNC